MATANDIVARAFSRAGMRASESALEPEEIQDGFDLLNDMLSAWEPVHQLGFSPLDGVADNVRIPRFANAAVIDSLAIMLTVEYGKPLPPVLAASAKITYSLMLTATTTLDNVDYPSTLPIGSGNECNDNTDDARFFPQKDEVNF